MKINIKSALEWVRNKIGKHPTLMRILTQVVMFITTFGWQNKSEFWHIVCIASMGLMTVFAVSDGRLRNATLKNGDEIVEILQTAIAELSETIEVPDPLETAENADNKIAQPLPEEIPTNNNQQEEP